MVIVGGLLGMGVGLGAWLCLRSLAPRTPPLAAVLAGLDRPGTSLAEVPGRAAKVGFVERLATRCRRVLADLGLPVLPPATLELAGTTPERQALAKVATALGTLGALNLMALSLAASSGGGPAGVLAALSFPLAAAGFVLPDVAAREGAERRRRAFRHSLSAYLDLVNILLAGGAGIETALWAAADAGDGWAFGRIRGALHRSRLTGQSPWDTLAALGRTIGIPELSELAASVNLAGSHGARIRASLAAKADTLRGHQMAETEANAESATERMTVPLAVFLAGFLLFIAYPAVQQITTSTGGGFQP